MTVALNALRAWLAAGCVVEVLTSNDVERANLWAALHDPGAMAVAEETLQMLMRTGFAVVTPEGRVLGRGEVYLPRPPTP